MTTQRLIELFKEIKTNISFIYGNIDDLFCDKKFRLSNFDYQSYEILKDSRTAFINKDKVLFYDSKSYNSFLGNPIQEQDYKKLITFSNKKFLLEQIFKKQFIRQLSFFLKQDIRTFYIIDIENNEDIFNVLYENYNTSNYFIIKTDNLELLNKIIKKYYLNEYSIIEVSNPKNDEIYNLLNRLRIKNNISFNNDLLSSLEIKNLLSLYESIKDLKNTDINHYLESIKSQKNKANDIWIEF
ncbi:MAG: hypothetical protein U0354_12865 [Candidatus Sericytochromatia bacterium]